MHYLPVESPRLVICELLSIIWSGPMNTRRGFLRALGMGEFAWDFRERLQAVRAAAALRAVTVR